jgi:alpha-L-fucosidase
MGYRVKKIFLMGILVLTVFVSGSHANENNETYVPSPANIEARKWFQDSKFGIFLHWGVYSVLAGGGDMGAAEWIMENKQIPIKQYEKLPAFFNPQGFDADEWVRSFKEAGAKYITITTKHHDGFAMYDSTVSDYNIVDRTPFKRDVMKELKEACDRHGLKLFFYYSQLDWHHPDYYPRGRTGQQYTGRPEEGDWDKYIDYQNAQLRELLTNYGDIGGFWFDGWWDQERGPYRDRWRLEETYKMIHDLQPQALVINNHHVKPFAGEDVQPFEEDLPGENDKGFNTSFVSDEMPLEMAETMSNTWGYNFVDDDFKSAEELIKTLVGAAGRNANFLMNTGPMSNGRIQPESLMVYKEMGEWMKIYGDSIYETRGGPIGPRPWGVTTQKDSSIFVHILDWQDEILALPLGDIEIASVTLLKNGVEIAFSRTGDDIVLTIPEVELNEWDVVIKLMTKLTIDKKAELATLIKSLIDKKKFSKEDWLERGVNPSSKVVIDKMNKVTNQFLISLDQADILALSEDQMLETVEKIMDKIPWSDFDTAERDFIFEEIKPVLLKLEIDLFSLLF